MDNPSSPDAAPAPAPRPGSLPRSVRLRDRHDGWTPERQYEFIAALAETGCVAMAAKEVGMNPRSAYRLRARAEANIFRQAWDIALDFAIRNLGEAALSRSINGVARPVFYKGEQIGERVYYDERLTQFLLRYRDPVHYGAWRDSYAARRHPDGAGIVLAHALNTLMDAGHGVAPPTDRDDIEAPLAEGPLPEAEVDLPFSEDPALSDEPPELYALRQALREGCRPEVDPDDEVHDWRDPSIVFRSNRESKFKIP